VLGSGAGGKLIAWTSAQKDNAWCGRAQICGRLVPDIACLPSKNIIHSARLLVLLPPAASSHQQRECSLNMAAVRERKRKMVRGLVDFHLDTTEERREL